MRSAVSLSLLLLALACGGAKTEFESGSEFNTAMKDEGWARLGSFGSVKWPAKISDEATAPNEIEFRTPDGVPHRYPGYTGYTLRVVHLAGANGTKATYVFRSAEKK